MPIFYFNLCEADDEIIVDEEGKELPSLWQAMEWATSAARDIMAADVTRGHLNLARSVIIEDAAHAQAMRVEFGDVLKLTGR